MYLYFNMLALTLLLLKKAKYIANKLGHNYYLKHDVEDDIITASYVCFVYNNAEHCLKGADNGASFAANTQTIQDFQTFNITNRRFYH